MSEAYLRFPHLHADLITFVAEDDVWLAPVEGGRAARVTADQFGAERPRFSPDGSMLAWTSWRDVDPEVHVAPVDGGPGLRLTYWGDPRTTVLGWTPDGEVLAASAAAQGSIRRTWAYAIPAGGGPARRLPYGPVGGLALGPDGVVLLASVISREPAWWKRYRGGTAGKLWLDPTGEGEFVRILSEVDGNLTAPMWWRGRIAFLSDHEGVGSVYSCASDGTDVRRHTETEFYARNASTDGERVIYQCAGQLWLLTDLDAAPVRVDIRLSGPRGLRAPYPLRAEDGLGEVAPDRIGRASAVEVRGTVHWLTHRDGPARALAAQPGVRARLPRVLGTDRVVWVTDADGEDALEIVPVDGLAAGTAPRRIGAGRLGRILELATSQDGRRLAVITHDGRVLLVDSDGGGTHELIRATERDPAGLAFSPDSGWLAWSHPGPDPLRHIKMASIADLSIVDVTPLRFTDSEPVFTMDGTCLAFLSARSFDPVYDAHVFDLSFANGSRPYLVPLAATTPSPFAPELHGRPPGDTDAEKSKQDDSPRSTVDIDGLTERVVPFPVPAARYENLRAVKNGVLWTRQPISGVLGDDLAHPDDDEPDTVLERYDLAKRRTHTVATGLESVWTSGDGERIVLWDGGDLRVLAHDHKNNSDDDDDDGEISVDLSRIRVHVDPAAEWRQSFDEAGRLMRDHFWRGDMGGVDWAGVLDRYRPLVETLGCQDDLVDLLWEVQGELGTSHAYVLPPSGDVEHERRLGLLGADLTRDPDGVWRIESVVPGEPSDPKARSPLRAPGVAVRPGDAILAVDGHPVAPELGPGPLLIGAAGNPVELTIGPAGGGAPRRVVVVPLLDDTPLRYQAWVTDRRAYTHATSDGRVGYLHVPDMLAAGWAQLHRDLRLEVRREALVVDVRENRGGHLSQLVVEKLARRVIGWQIARDNHYAEPYPQDAPRGPVVAIANEFSGSDGDLVNAAVKAMGIGPVVGVRTWGGTIGVDMRYHLVDGTLVTQPRYASWMQGPGWGVENHGVDPDVEMVMAPQDHAAGRDPQLDTAIRLALEALAETPAATPPELPPL